MANKIIRFKVNSTVINKEFLKKLGVIIEGNKRDKLNINYTINTKENGEIQYENMKDLLSTSFFPEKINSIILNVENRLNPNKNTVDIKIHLDNISYLSLNIRLSSKSDEKLLKLQESLKKLFWEFRTGYQILYKPKPWFFILWAPIITLLLLTTLILWLSPSGISMEILLLLAIFPLLFIWILFQFFFEYLFPYFSFELLDREGTNKKFRKFFVIILMSIIAAFLYNVGSLIITKFF